MAEAPKLTEEQAKALQEKLKNMSPQELERLQRENCIFCKIIHGEMQTRKIYEDNVCIAALDIAPASKGHILIIPKEHYAIMPQVPDPVLSYIFVIAKRLSQILLKTLKVSGTNLFMANGSVAGQRAQHFLLHLIPRKEGDKILDLEEKIISKEMVEKIKTAVEDRLFRLMGVHRPEIKKVDSEFINSSQSSSPDQDFHLEEESEGTPPTAEKKVSKYISSPTAKKFHIPSCMIAKNIPVNKRVEVDPDNSNGRVPCHCTGLGAEKSEVNRQTKSKQKHQSVEIIEEESSPDSVEDGAETGGNADLDDIANLFR